MIQLPSMYVTLGVLRVVCHCGRKVRRLQWWILRERYEGNRAVTVLAAFFIVAFLMAAGGSVCRWSAAISICNWKNLVILAVYCYLTVVMVYVTLGGFAAVAK